MSRISSMASLWRTLSGSTGKEITHQHPLQVQLRPCQSLDINAEGATTGSKEGVRSFASTSMPNYSVDSAGSLSESLHSSSPTGSQLGAESPTAAQQQKQRRPYKIQGMDPYDYWSMIKSL